MLDRSKDYQRLISFFEMLESDDTETIPFHPKVCTIPEGYSLKQVEEVLGDKINLDDEELFILTHEQTQSLLDEEIIPKEIKEGIIKTYEEAKADMLAKKDLLDRFSELKETIEESDDPVNTLKLLLQLSRMVGPDLFDYDNYTVDNAQCIGYLMKGMELLPFIEAFPLALGVTLTFLADQNDEEPFIEDDKQEYFKRLSNIADELLPVMLHAIKENEELDFSINSHEDLILIASMLIGKVFESASFLETFTKEKRFEEKPKIKKEGKILHFKTDTDKVN